MGSELSAHLLCYVVSFALLAHAGQALGLALDAVAVVAARLQNVAVLDLVDDLSFSYHYCVLICRLLFP